MKSKSKLPKHRQLLIESMELLFSGNETKSKEVLKKAELEINKFYKN